MYIFNTLGLISQFLNNNNNNLKIILTIMMKMNNCNSTKTNQYIRVQVHVHQLTITSLVCLTRSVFLHSSGTVISST